MDPHPLLTSPKPQRGAIRSRYQPETPARRDLSLPPPYSHDEVLRIVGRLSAYNSSGVLTETRHYYFSDQWQIVREMVSGSTAALYIWGLRFVDELLVRYDPTYGRKYAMQDANFNCTAICDDATGAGTVDERYQYDPYAGNRIILDGSWNVISASAYNWTVGHQGLMFEAEVGLYNCRNRVYLPKMGTWMQRDPLGYADGGNLYEYVRSQVLINVDPSGNAYGGTGRVDMHDNGGTSIHSTGAGQTGNGGGNTSGKGCKIELRCKDLVFGGGSSDSPSSGRSSSVGGISHCYLVYTDITGKKQEGCRGGPTGLFRDGRIKGTNDKLPDCGDWNIFRGAWGPINTYCGPFDPTFPDGFGDDKKPINDPSRTVLTGMEACSKWSCIKQAMQDIENCCTPYELLGPNSNTTVRVALEKCGIEVPKPPTYMTPAGWTTPWHCAIEA